MAMTVLVDGRNGGYQAGITSQGAVMVEQRPRASATSSVTDTVGTASQQLFGLSDLDADAVQIQNLSGVNNLHISFGTAGATVGDFMLPPGAVYTTPPGMRYEGEIQAIATGAATPVAGIVWRTGST